MNPLKYVRSRAASKGSQPANEAMAASHQPGGTRSSYLSREDYSPTATRPCAGPPNPSK